jgi:hypothetical protein
MGEFVNQHDGTLTALAHVDEGKAEQHRHDQHRHDLALGKVADHVGGYHLGQEIDNGHRLCAGDEARDRLWIEARRVDVQTGACREQVADDQADDQRNGGDHLEIDDGAQTNQAHSPHVAHPGDADNDGREYDRWHDGSDEADESVADRLHVDAKLRPGLAEQDAHDDGDQNLYV